MFKQSWQFPPGCLVDDVSELLDEVVWYKQIIVVQLHRVVKQNVRWNGNAEVSKMSNRSWFSSLRPQFIYN